MTGRYRPAGGGNETPSGTFKPFHMEIDHYSKEWDNAPMPYSIFFTQSGDAIHGTYDRTAAFAIAAERRNSLGLGETGEYGQYHWLLTGTTPDARPPAVARSGPMPLTADDPHYGVPPPQYQRRSDDYGGPMVAQTPHDYDDSDDPPNEVPPRPQYKPRYEDDDSGPLLPFPFLFDR